MRRSILLSTVLAATVSVLGACSGTPAPDTPPVKPVVTTTPATVSSPTPSPSPSPGTTPVKPSDTKKVDDKVGDKEVKPIAAQTPKAK